MKSIFYVIAFIILAVVFSKPEKSTIKYIPLTFSFSQNLNNSNTSEYTKVQFLPDSISKQYNIQFNKSLDSEISNYNFNFKFENCKINRRPKISIACKTKIKSKKGHISKVNLQPLIILGEENITNYLFEVTYQSKNGVFKKLKFLSDIRNLSIPKKNNKDIKVTHVKDSSF